MAPRPSSRKQQRGGPASSFHPEQSGGPDPDGGPGSASIVPEQQHGGPASVVLVSSSPGERFRKWFMCHFSTGPGSASIVPEQQRGGPASSFHPEQSGGPDPDGGPGSESDNRREKTFQKIFYPFPALYFKPSGGIITCPPEIFFGYFCRIAGRNSPEALFCNGFPDGKFVLDKGTNPVYNSRRRDGVQTPQQ